MRLFLNSLIISFATIIAAIITFSSCKKTSSNAKTSKVITAGTWRITSFLDSGNDRTSRFSGYNFDFKSKGELTASNGSNSIIGTWKNVIEDSKEKLIFEMGTISPFNQLNEDWYIVEKTSTKIKLEDTSGGNGGADIVTFEKN